MVNPRQEYIYSDLDEDHDQLPGTLHPQFLSMNRSINATNTTTQDKVFHHERRQESFRRPHASQRASEPSQRGQFASDSGFNDSNNAFDPNIAQITSQSHLFVPAQMAPRHILQPKSRMSQTGKIARNSSSRGDGMGPSSLRNNGIEPSPRNAMIGTPSSHNDPFSRMPPLPAIVTSKAHAMKTQLGPSPNIPVVENPRKRVLPEHDPENYEIKRMRCDEKMSWGAIAEHMNRVRIENGKAPTFTEAAVYGRFVRNGPRIARVSGEDFSTKDHMHIKDKRSNLSTRGVKSEAKFTERHDVFLVEAYAEVQAAFWDSVAETLYEKCGQQYTKTECAKRFSQL
jgi:hypothetical protein